MSDEAVRGASEVGDDDLVRGAAAGDREALAVLYERHAPALYAIAQRMLKSTSDAEDLLHDVFLEAWRHAGEHDAARGSVRWWLAVRLRSRALDRLRSAARTRVRSLDSGSSGAVEPAVAPVEFVEVVDMAAVDEAIAALGDAQRAVIEQTYRQGLTLATIAEREGVPIGTIKSRLGRALSRLREALSGAHAEGGELQRLPSEMRDTTAR